MQVFGGFRPSAEVADLMKASANPSPLRALALEPDMRVLGRAAPGSPFVLLAEDAAAAVRRRRAKPRCWVQMHLGFLCVERRWNQWPLMLLMTWFTVDGCYWLYWSWKNPLALDLMRSANAPASLALYWMCGLVWFYRGTLKEIVADARRWKTSRDE